MQPTRYVYKIKDITDGYFSLGGESPRWSKKGKTWKRLRDVYVSIRRANERWSKQYYFPHKHKIIEIPIVELEPRVLEIDEDRADPKIQRERQREERIQSEIYQMEIRIQQLKGEL